MPVLIPTAKDEIVAQSRMIREGLQVHDAECCSANEPCTLRRGMQAVLDRLNGAPATLAPRVQAPAPVKRPQGSGNGFGTAKPARTGRDATDGQKGMIRKLAAAKNITEYRGQDLETFLATMKMADKDAAREYMLAQPWPSKKTEAPANSAVTEGMYRLANGDIYKVQVAVHGSGRLYAKKLMQDGDEWYFERVVGGLRKLTPADRMTVEEAAEFGKLYGICVRCAATLTDEDSIARGMGKVCAGKI